MGLSQVHSSLVALVLNTSTGKISPQYHVVFNDKFATVNSLLTKDSIDTQWKLIFKLRREFYLDIEYDSSGNIITSDWPKLDDEWLNLNEQQCHVFARPATQVSEGASDKDATQAPEGARTRDGPAMNTRSQVKANEPQYASFDAAQVWGQPPPDIANRGHSVPSAFHGNAKVTRAFLAAQPIFCVTWIFAAS